MDWEWMKERTAKPRQSGVTMVIDTGLGMNAFRDLLNIAGPYIDFVKLGFGTAGLTPSGVLQEKIACAKEHGTLVYPGGTFFEAAFARGCWERYMETLEQVGFPAVEISEGSLTLPPGMRQKVISQMSESFLVLSEVGKKEKGTRISCDQLYRTYEQDRLAGASYVIVEGRESGKDVGIYDKNGELDPEFVQEAQKRCGTDIIWEAPLKSQQSTLIQLLGANVNLGNVASKDALAVEALRHGLRSDTFSLNLQPELSTQ